MKSYALINKVTNIIDDVIYWDGESNWIPPNEYLLKCIDDMQVGCGFIYDVNTDTFIAPPKPLQENIE